MREKLSAMWNWASLIAPVYHRAVASKCMEPSTSVRIMVNVLMTSAGCHSLFLIEHQHILLPVQVGAFSPVLVHYAALEHSIQYDATPAQCYQ